MLKVEYFREDASISDIRMFKDDYEIWKWLSDMSELGENVYIIEIKEES